MLCRQEMTTPLSPLPTPRRRPMEDIWREIGLSGLENHLATRSASKVDEGDTSSRAFLQEFLARPFAEDAERDPDHQLCGYDQGASPRLSDHVTALRLSSSNDPVELINSSMPKKRSLEDLSDHSGDRRQQRMMKNRESAARSRARKQAYTNELEMEVSHLMGENAKLRRKILQQESCVAAAASAQSPTKRSLASAQSSTKRSLPRTSSCPI